MKTKYISVLLFCLFVSSASAVEICFKRLDFYGYGPVPAAAHGNALLEAGNHLQNSNDFHVQDVSVTYSPVVVGGFSGQVSVVGWVCRKTIVVGYKCRKKQTPEEIKEIIDGLYD